MESANQIKQQQNNELIPEEQLKTEVQQKEVQGNVEGQQPLVVEAQEMLIREAEGAKNQEDQSMAVEESSAAPQVEISAAPQGEYLASPQRESSAAPQDKFSASPQGESSAAPQGESSAAPQGESSAAPQGKSSAAPQGKSSAATQGESSAATQGESPVAPQGKSSAAPQGESSAAPQGESSAAPQGKSSAAPQGKSSAATQGESSAATQGKSSASPQGESPVAPQGKSSAAPQGESSAAPQGESSAAPQGESSPAPQVEEVIEEKSIFVGGISSSVRQEDLVEYFTQFGEVKEVTVKEKIKIGKSFRFAFVNFADPANNDKVLAIAEHKVGDTKIDVKLSLPKISPHKLFVRNIGSLTDEEIRNHFSKFGQAGRIERPSGKDYCFVSLQTAHAADEASKEAKQTIGSTEVTVSKAHPPYRDTQNRGRGEMSSRGYNRRDAPWIANYCF